LNYFNLSPASVGRVKWINSTSAPAGARKSLIRLRPIVDGPPAIGSNAGAQRPEEAA
jgi:hypothetical protein